MMSDDPLACVSIAVATRGYLSGVGLGFPHPFRLRILRVDGETVEIAVLTLPRVAELVADMQPTTVTVSAADDEDEAELLDLILGRRAVH
jgi:hypothetical protein